MSFPTSLLAFIKLWGLTRSLTTAIAIVTVIVLFLSLTAGGRDECHILCAENGSEIAG